MSYNVIVTQETDGRYSADVPQLPGCHTFGDTLEELRANFKEAIALYLDVETETLI